MRSAIAAGVTSALSVDGRAIDGDNVDIVDDFIDLITHQTKYEHTGGHFTFDLPEARHRQVVNLVVEGLESVGGCLGSRKHPKGLLVSRRVT